MVMPVVVMVIQAGCHGDMNGSSTRTHTHYIGSFLQSLNLWWTSRQEVYLAYQQVDALFLNIFLKSELHFIQ